ncbi:hypothetical protein PoB_007131100 [Plakobranchus ocellatus]|uniref:Peptidase S1 domain-containing protein n=1 Tax=Plakobranchus ocellatus TaxID=259542 RepID=A0AAV4DLS2_9GAST|nr:hypothetical protein PoB_007131100 [Plakobranchus ocellatus]
MDQGNHECEVLGSGPEAAESASTWNSCRKNPRHLNFIPAANFCRQHLRRRFADDQVVLDLVRNISYGTVCLRVGYTSAERPEGYSFYNHRRSKIVHTGSGWLHALTPGIGPCRCSDCAGSSTSTRHQKWYEIYIDTACHVVFNSKEAKFTTVEFFYDDETARADGTMKSVSGLKLIHRDIADDCCRMICATHDQSLVDTLKLCLEQRVLLYQGFMSSPRYAWQDLCVIVSHPHGQPKHITVGEIERWEARGRHRRRFMYSTDTCPGSSGAPVLVLDDILLTIKEQIWITTHSEGEVEGKLNCSGTSYLIPRTNYEAD